jgi:hypothetical protein
VLVYAAKRIGVTRWEPGALARTLLASVGAGLAGWLAQRWLGGVAGLLVGLVAAGAAFAALAATLRILIAEDAEWLESVLGLRLGGRVGRAIRMCAHQAEAG